MVWSGNQGNSRAPNRIGAANTSSFQSPWVLLRSGTNHPFIYQRMIREADSAAKPGDIVNVYDKGGALLGRGIFNPKSQIGVRILVHGNAAIDEAFWQQRIDSAISLRRQLSLDAVTDAYRLIHAEGDNLSGLIAERYADCLVFEVFSLGMFQRIDMISACIAKAMGAPQSLDRPAAASKTWRIVIRADEWIERSEGFKVSPRSDAPKEVVIREHGIRYRVDLAEGQKTGFFCDQRDNRRQLASFCRDASVLDLCCYTGGFALCAQKLGNAKEVTAVDLDETALAVARQNANLNNCRINFAHSDAFIYLRQLIANRRQFDVVVLDPPKLATSREEIEIAMRKYYDMNGLAMQVVRPGGILLSCSCSGLVSREMFWETLSRSARYVKRSYQVLGESGAGCDHPVMSNCPESSYLKAAWMRML